MIIYQRLMKNFLLEVLQDSPAVCLLGARQVGKTTLAQDIGQGRAYFSFDDVGLVSAVQLDPMGFIESLPERVILDEVQRVPEIMPALKMTIDKNRTAGRFLLTGSANLLLLASVQESLAGRMEIVNLQPLSEIEKEGGQKSILQELLEGSIKTQINPAKHEGMQIAKKVCEGGYPEPLTRQAKSARRWFRNYVNAIVQRDVQDVADIRDKDSLAKLVELLALRSSSLLNITSVANELGINRKSVNKYISIFERLFLVRQLPAWHSNKAKRLIKTPKIHMVDTGLASALCGLKTSDWNTESELFGSLLESFVVQQIICQSGWVNDELRFSHYRDKDQVEVDLVIEDGKNIWGIEVKKSANFKSSDFSGLRRISDKLGKHFKGGIVFYNGSHTVKGPVANCFAVPLNRLW